MDREFININGLVTEVTNYACKYVSAEEKEEFKKYFEDIICYEVISSTKLEVCSNEKRNTSNIQSSLIASGINSEGVLDEGLSIERMVKYIHLGDYKEAKARVKELEREQLGKSFKELIAETSAESLDSEEVIDPATLVLIGCAMKDRECGYYETLADRVQNNYVKDAKKLWLEEKQKYFKYGLTDKPYYIILKEIFENPAQHHYPLVTRETLAKAANITYRLDNDEQVSIPELQELNRLNDASTLVGMNVLDKFDEKINEVSGEYVRRHQSEKTKVLKTTK